MRPVRARHAVRPPQAAEIPTLHGAGEAFAGARPSHVNELANDEMIRRDLGADRKQRVFFDTEFGQLHFGLDLGEREVATLRFRYVLDLGAAYAKLERGIAIAILGPMRHDLTAIELQHRDRPMFAPAGVDTGHVRLLCDDT